MESAPKTVGGARVIQWSLIDERHRLTERTKQIVDGELQGPAAALAVCQYDGEEAYYLFGCDEKWNAVTDTWHQTLEDALQQAEFEYDGISGTWNVV